MLDIGGWYLTMFDKPMFQFAQGIVIGVLIMGAIWALCSCLKAEDVQKEVMRMARTEGEDAKQLILRVIKDRKEQGIDKFCLWVPQSELPMWVQAVRELGVGDTCIVRPFMDDETVSALSKEADDGQE